MNRKLTAWKKNRKLGDIYGGRKWLRLSDNIFARAHSLKRPDQSDDLPILIQDNPSRDYFFPISVNEAKEAIKALPKRDYEGITHIWLRRFKKTEYEKGHLPLAQFICGSGVRVIVLYPFPKSMILDLGSKKPSTRKLKELSKWSADLHYANGSWILKWKLPELRKYVINNLLYHEIGHHIDWYYRNWSKANSRQLEEFADQYAMEKTATALRVFNKLENMSGSSST